MSTASRIENWSTITHSHVRERNSRQPVARSEMKLCTSARDTSSSRISATIPAAARYVAASNAIATPGPKPATMKPASAAPPIAVAFRASASSAFASCSSAGGTVCGVTPADAGK